MATQRLGMVIDVHRCYGCHSCVVACKQENNVPNGIWWCRAVTDGGESVDTGRGTYPDAFKRYFTVACQHCENPACTKVCPVGATYKEEESGIVLQNYDTCIGCRMCIAACPYTEVRSFNWEEPAYSIDVATGDQAVPPHQKHTVEKCTLCYHRISAGEEPACVMACPSYARHFGDLNDPDSAVSRLLSESPYWQLLPERGTNPSVYYLDY